MKWKEDPSKENQGLGEAKNGVGEGRDLIENHNEIVSVENNNSRREENEIAMKASRKCRKIPVTKRDDFLWTTTSKKVKVEKEGKMKQKPKPDMISILHLNVQNINNKLLKLNISLQSELADVDVLCLSKPWLREDYIKLISVDKFKLARNFNRSKSNHGGSCIYVKYHVQTKEINYLKGISKEKDFEMTEVEILDCKLIIVCVCV